MVLDVGMSLTIDGQSIGGVVDDRVRSPREVVLAGYELVSAVDLV